jgi:hypothetical protein
MIKFNKLLKAIFYFTNLILILIYLYPGSILGYILYNDFEKQPQITADFLNISSSHFYSFAFLAVTGILAFLHDKKVYFIVKYLFLISIILELFHLVIPARMFEFADLLGNILGVLTIFIIYKILKYN